MRRKVMCTLDRDKNKKENMDDCCNFWQNTQYCYHITEGGPEHLSLCRRTVTSWGNDQKTIKEDQIVNSRNNQPSAHSILLQQRYEFVI